MLSQKVQSIVKRDSSLCEEDIWHYVQLLLANEQNAQNPYHNARHGLHIMEMCLDALLYHIKMGAKITPDDILVLAIAGPTHDLNHRGKLGKDWINMRRMARALYEGLLPHHRHLYKRIIRCNRRATLFPHVVPVSELSWFERYLREADMTQIFAEDWYEHVIVGLAREWNMTELEILEKQESFLEHLWSEWQKSGTEWIRQKFPRRLFDQRIRECKSLMSQYAA